MRRVGIRGGDLVGKEEGGKGSTSTRGATSPSRSW